MILLSSSIGILIEIRTNQTELELESVQLKQNPNRNLDKSIGIPWEPGQSMCHIITAWSLQVHKIGGTI